MNPADIFSYDDITRYLSDVASQEFGWGSEVGALTKATQALGYASPRTLAMVLKGQREASQEMVFRFSELLRLSPSEFYHLEALRWKKRGRAPQQLRPNTKFLEQTELLNTKLRRGDPNRFGDFSKWYVLVIKHVLELLCRQNTNQLVLEAEIVKTLSFKVSKAQVHYAMNLLQQAGYVEQNSDGSWTCFNVQFEFPPFGCQDVRFFHQQMLKKSLEALEEHSAESREFQALTLNFNSEKLNEAKQYLQAVIQDFARRFDTSDSDSVFQLNIQLFAHTSQQIKD